MKLHKKVFRNSLISGESRTYPSLGLVRLADIKTGLGAGARSLIRDSYLERNTQGIGMVKKVFQNTW